MTDAPAIPSLPKRRRSSQPFWLAGGLVLAVIALHFASAWHLPLPQCGLKRLTGLPCPFCGSTRGLLAWAEFDPALALRLNPLTFFVCCAALGWAALASWDAAFGQRRLPALRARVQRWLTTPIVLGLVLANWIYVLWTLPR